MSKSKFYLRAIEAKLNEARRLIHEDIPLTYFWNKISEIRSKTETIMRSITRFNNS